MKCERNSRWVQRNCCRPFFSSHYLIILHSLLHFLHILYWSLKKGKKRRASVSKMWNGGWICIILLINLGVNFPCDWLPIHYFSGHRSCDLKLYIVGKGKESFASNFGQHVKKREGSCKYNLLTCPPAIHVHGIEIKSSQFYSMGRTAYDDDIVQL